MEVILWTMVLGLAAAQQESVVLSSSPASPQADFPVDLPSGSLANRTLRLERGHYHLRADLVVESSSKLVLEPGVRISFAPMIGITVRGVILAEEIANEVKGEKGKVYPVKADLTNEKEIESAFAWIETNLKQPVHILINNAGVSILRDTIDGRMDEWKKMFDTNVFATGICIREFLKTLKKHNVDGGHIVNICSIVGHRIIDFPGFYVYSATKHAVRVITEGVRQELLKKKLTTKVTSISPGYVATELFDTANDYSKESAKSLLSFAHLVAPDVSSAVMYALSLPPNVRVHELTIQATGEFY